MLKERIYSTLDEVLSLVTAFNDQITEYKNALSMTERYTPHSKIVFNVSRDAGHQRGRGKLRVTV